VIGLDPAADPSYDETVRVRGDRQSRVRELLDRLRDDDLDRPTNHPPAPGYPTQERTVGYCLRVVMNEECAHRGYAERDLAALENQHDGPIGPAIRR
jgi:DinB superfamily